MRNKIVQAMDAQFRSDLMGATAKLEVYLENPVGIGDHSNITGEAAKLVGEICEATERVKYVQKLYDKEEPIEGYSDDLEQSVNMLVNKMDNFLTALGGKNEGEE